MKKETLNLVALVVVVLFMGLFYLELKDKNRYVPSPDAKNVVIDTKTGDVYYFTESGSKKIGIKK
jgi:hypothetical protein